MDNNNDKHFSTKYKTLLLLHSINHDNDAHKLIKMLIFNIKNCKIDD